MKFLDALNPEKARKRAEAKYLNDAVDLVDLEARMRDIDRGKFRNNAPLFL